MVDDRLLLFIEPSKSPSKEPLIDELTRKMTASFRKGIKGLEYFSLPQNLSGDKVHKIGDRFFIENHGYRGFHSCKCGATSGNANYLLVNGEITNSLCIHYLAYHRDEISNEQLERVKALNDGEEAPVLKELRYSLIER